MFVDKDSIYVESLSIGQYLIEAETQYNKLWGEDTGRNLLGDFSGTFNGIYPKLILTFRKLNQAEMHLLAPYLDTPYHNVTYYDDNKGTKITKQMYTGDWGNKSNRIGVAEGVQCSFISTKKRS